MSVSPQIVTRYVLVELAKVFAVSLIGLTALLLLIGVLRQAWNEGIGLKHTLLLIPYVLPEALRFTIPATALFSAACVYGRMSGANEVVALKALGISPLKILWPAYVLAFGLSLVAVWLNDVAVTWGYGGMRRVVLEAMEDVVIRRLQMKKEFSTQSFSIIVKDVQDRRMIDPVFTVHGRKGSRAIMLRCQSARLQSNGNRLLLHCYNGSADVDGQTEYEFPDSEMVQEIDIEQFRDDRTHEWSPAYMSLAEVYRQLDQHPHAVERLSRDHAVKAAIQLMAADFDSLTGGEWSGERTKVDDLAAIYNRLRTEPPRRFANGFSCLSFVLVGGAMAIRLRNSNALSSFFVCFLPILIVYYPMLVLSVDQAKNGAVHPWSAWLGNVVLGLWGAWLLRGVMRY